MVSALGEAWADLEGEILGDVPDYDTPAPELPDADAVNRSIGRLAKIRARAQADREVADAQVGQVREWLARRLETHDGAAAWHEGQLASYHAALLRDDKNRRTVSLPAGTLKVRKGQPGWEFDADVFLGWARDHLPAAVDQPPAPAERIDKAEAKRALTRRDAKNNPIEHGLTADGERPPGLTVEPAVDKFTVVTS